MTDVETVEGDVPEGVTVLGMIGAWSQDTERFLMDKLKGLVFVLNGDAPLE